MKVLDILRPERAGKWKVMRMLCQRDHGQQYQSGVIILNYIMQLTGNNRRPSPDYTLTDILHFRGHLHSLLKYEQQISKMNLDVWDQFRFIRAVV